LNSKPNPARGAGASPSPTSAHPMPRWVKVFAVLALIGVTLAAALHIAGVGMGHLAHKGMDAHAPLTGHGEHQP
jgi:hypothetical protein